MTDDGSGVRLRAKAVDVAERAGVSIATVSLVANGKARGRVSDGTQARVQLAIEELGYVVNPAARSLVTGRRHCIALLAQDMTNPFISQIASGVARALDADTQLLLALSGVESDTPDLAKVAAFGVDGILMNFPSPKQVAQALDTPIVYLDDPVARHDLSRVYFDVTTGAGQLARHLAELGHRSIAYLDAARPWPTFSRRRRSLVEELLRQAPDTVVTRARSDIDISSARAAVLTAWPSWQAEGVTAIVTAADVQAHGVLAALATLGVSVPGQVSVASFDNVPFSAITSPSLTSVDLPAFDLGFEAATLLQDVIERGGRGARTTVLPTALVTRASTGPAPTVPAS